MALLMLVAGVRVTRLKVCRLPFEKRPSSSSYLIRLFLHTVIKITGSRISKRFYANVCLVVCWISRAILGESAPNE
jgi:hypothetical protein